MPFDSRFYLFNRKQLPSAKVIGVISQRPSLIMVVNSTNVSYFYSFASCNSFSSMMETFSCR
jgi:hypothetical protein